MASLVARTAAALWPPKSCGAACMYSRASFSAAMAPAMRGCMARSFCANSVIPALRTTPRTIPEMNFMSVFSLAGEQPPQKSVRRCGADANFCVSNRLRSALRIKFGLLAPLECSPRELSGRRRPALVPIGVGLEFASDGEQGVLGERDAHHLESHGHVLGEAAGQHQRGKPGEIAHRNDGAEAGILGRSAAGAAVERLIDLGSNAGAAGGEQNVHRTEDSGDCFLYQAAQAHRLEVIPGGQLQARSKAGDLRLVGQLIVVAAGNQRV